jgi:hypothetical protein
MDNYVKLHCIAFSYTDSLKLTQFQVTQFQNAILKRKKIIFWNRALNFTLREWKCSETRVAEEYCWAITQTTGLSCCRRLCSGVLESWISSGLPCKIHVYLTTCVLSSDLRRNFQNITA